MVKKGIVVVMAAAMMATAMVGCGNVSFEKTTTNTVTDKDGKTVTTTTVTDQDGTKTTTVTDTDGEEAADIVTATVVFENDSDTDIDEIYVRISGEEDWTQANLGEDGLKADKKITFKDALSYDSMSTDCDIKIKDANGETTEINDVSMSMADDKNNIVFEIDNDLGEYMVTVD